MDKIINLSDKDRETLFLQTSSDINIPFAMVEKDFWVCYVLSKIFSNEELANALRFKGGTSLSKGYGLIKRFSEDLDLILDKTLILGEEDLFKPSYKKQREFAYIISEKTASYISGTLKDKIAKVLGNPLKIYTDEEYTKINPMYNPVNIDNKSLHLVYPKSSKDGYLRPDILLEIGIMSARTPWEYTNIISSVGETYPELNIKGIAVPTVMPKRTFWDKATILHREYYRPETTHTPSRYSRHYYDLYQMGHSLVKKEALDDKELLADVVLRKDRLYHCAWAKYDECLTGNIHLLPNDNNKQVLEDDYRAMQGMIYGNKPNWNDILEYLAELEKEINSL